MFTVQNIETRGGPVQYRRETLTDLRCRISTERIKRGIDRPFTMTFPPDNCPFCPDMLKKATPTFEDGTRIEIGESVTFPNLYPFAARHTVTVITRDHAVDSFTEGQLRDALEGQVQSLLGGAWYPSINWNHLPSSGASIAHPHMQGVADPLPSALAERYLLAGYRYLLRHGKTYWDMLRDCERQSERYLFENEILWTASAVPLGQREIRGLLPVRTLAELEPYIDTLAADMLRIIRFYRETGSHAFNASIFFDKPGYDAGFRAFCSFITRINPNPFSTGDSAFMERLHLEPIILSLPEEVGATFRGMQ
jgi:UDPglucose--hexose-1-phosphate uridylyltransferase